MAGRTVPITARTKDWPRLVSDELRRLQGRIEAVEPLGATITATGALPDEGDLFLVDATSGAVVITLPPASDGRRFAVKKVDASANTVTLDGSGSETIDGAATKVLTTQWQSYTVQGSGSANYLV